MDDRELMRQCKAGDSAAFWQLAHRHRQMVFRVARGILGVDDDAEDVVEEVLLRAYRAIARYDTRREPAAWLRTIAANCSLTACKRRSRNGRGLDDRDAVELPGTGPTPEQHALAGETCGLIHTAMASLSPKQRAVITLFALDELDLIHIADTVGCSLTTTKTHLHRARERLARALAEEHGEG